MAFCGQFCSEQGWESDAYRRTYGTIITCVQFLIPLAIISFCYCRILSKVGKDSMIQNKQFSSSLSEVQRVEAIKKRRRVNYILIMMVVAFGASWFPLTMRNIMDDYNMTPDFLMVQPYLMIILVHCAAMSTVIWNPLLFFWLTRSRRAQRGGFWQSVIVTTLLAWNPLSSFFRKKRRIPNPDESITRFSSVATKSGGRMSVNGSCSDFDSYIKFETESDPLKKASKSNSINGYLAASIVQGSPKRPTTLPGVGGSSPDLGRISRNDSGKNSRNFDADNISVTNGKGMMNSKLKKILFIKLGDSVNV